MINKTIKDRIEKIENGHTEQGVARVVIYTPGQFRAVESDATIVYLPDNGRD